MLRKVLILLAVVFVAACDAPDVQESAAESSTISRPEGNSNIRNNPVESIEPDKLIQVCRINSKSVSESSGIAVTDPDLGSFWTHNDSGHNSELYLIAISTGELISTVELAGARNVDWEDMAHFELGGHLWLMVADVGDNELKRKKCKLYVFDSSIADNRKKQTIEKKNVHELEFAYEDGPHDCEAVAVVDNGKTLLLVEKQMNPFSHPVVGVYQLDLPEEFVDMGKLTAKRITGISAWAVTGMDVSPDHRSLILRSYGGAQVYRRENDNQSWADVLKVDRPSVVPLPVQQQGEAICFTPDGKHVLITSEGSEAIVWQVELPAK